MKKKLSFDHRIKIPTVVLSDSSKILNNAENSLFPKKNEMNNDK